MKISEMTNDQACDAIVRLTQPIANITDDPAVEPMLKELASHEGENGVSALKIISSMLPKVVPLLLKDHKTDVYEIISVLSWKDRKAVGQMKLMETISVLRESIDEDLIGFFKSSVPAKEN